MKWCQHQLQKRSPKGSKFNRVTLLCSHSALRQTAMNKTQSASATLMMIALTTGKLRSARLRILVCASRSAFGVDVEKQAMVTPMREDLPRVTAHGRDARRDFAYFNHSGASLFSRSGTFVKSSKRRRQKSEAKPVASRQDWRSPSITR